MRPRLAGVTRPTRRVLTRTEVLARLDERRTPAAGTAMLAMFNSYLGGVVTDPALMALPLDDHLVHRGHGVFDTATLANGRLYRLGHGDLVLGRLPCEDAIPRLQAQTTLLPALLILHQRNLAPNCLAQVPHLQVPAQPAQRLQQRLQQEPPRSGRVLHQIREFPTYRR